MSWAGWSDFLAMGGHGLYVWASFGAALVLPAVEIALLAMRRRNILDYLRRVPEGREVP